MIQLSPPPRQGFELNWSILGIRFRVQPSFFLYAAIICGLFMFPIFGDPVALAAFIAINVACIFAALVFTQFVQGMVYKSYGIRSTVLIQEFGGGIFPDEEPPTTIQRIAVALANPASCFLLLALLYYSDQAYQWQQTSKWAQITYFLLTIISFFWGVIGLLPIFPYSGGRVMTELLTKISPRYGFQWTLLISIVIAVAYITYTLLVRFNNFPLIELWKGTFLPPSIILSFFFGLTAMRNWQLYQVLRQSRPRIFREEEDDDVAPWERR